MPIVCGKLSLIFSVPCLSSGPQSPGIRSGLKEKKGAIIL